MINSATVGEQHMLIVEFMKCGTITSKQAETFTVLEHDKGAVAQVKHTCIQH